MFNISTNVSQDFLATLRTDSVKEDRIKIFYLPWSKISNMSLKMEFSRFIGPAIFGKSSEKHLNI
jgi:hypothetical protein